MLLKLRPLAPIAAIALLAWLVFPFGFPNYDTVYMLVWGEQIANGVSPDMNAPVAPTPHPLAELWGALVSPFGATAASDLTTLVAYLALGAIAYLVYRLGALWFDRPIGVAAAAIVATRAPFLSNGLRAYVDLPYIALVLAALVLETRRPRAGWPVLALLAVAGLLRPEAWLFSVAYLVYLLLERDPEGDGFSLRRRAGIEPRRLAGLAALAASAPLGWALFDLVTASDPLYSFTGTRDTVETLERETGPVDLVLYGPRRLGEVMQIPGLFGAAAGMLLGLAFLRRRSLLGVAAAVLAGAAFAVLACAGLAIIPRYTMLASAVLCVFCAVALLGWRMLPDDHPWRGRWQLIAAVTAILFVVQAPQQLDYLDTVRTDLDEQSQVESDLHELADSGVFDPACMPISVPNHRAVPRLAAWLDISPSEIVSSTQQRQPRRGYFLEPASEEVVRHFVLDPNDPARYEEPVPSGFRRVRVDNDSWLLYARCSRTSAVVP
ncbi:MAG: hypothetical protein ACRDKV_00390 [Solirubrobacterales bacterium]